MESIYVGLLYIAIAVAVKFYPGLLAGYNSLSNSDKENAEANGLPTFTAIVFGIMGMISITAHFAAIWLNQPSLSNIFILVTIVGMLVLIVVGNILVNNRTR
ncbi:DUF3784 domain-containing protein [Algoriphagus winogradskyi]|uniref:DUF3784 domain-containing protein n=1 Tax=Algoriphagus winogradskyi TaxID=237017 RepID=A0ABY1P417_9BACT|nr:DUF3784 domain-containing protein [Algoriphagus winogradskyi]SMP25491.1 protein of unknown function [Algoriphagus winogradskyi]